MAPTVDATAAGSKVSDAKKPPATTSSINEAASRAVEVRILGTVLKARPTRRCIAVRSSSPRLTRVGRSSYAR
jgi:hypothetical protein